MEILQGITELPGFGCNSGYTVGQRGEAHRCQCLLSEFFRCIGKFCKETMKNRVTGIFLGKYLFFQEIVVVKSCRRRPKRLGCRSSMPGG